MRETFRLSMAYLHTWLGLVLGFVLIVVFFFGALSVFDREIDRWSVPETRVAPGAFPSFDRTIVPLLENTRPTPHDMEHAAEEVIGPLPPVASLKLSDGGAYTNHRDPLLRVYTVYDLPNKPKNSNEDHAHAFGRAALDPATGERLPDELQDRLSLGTGFFFPLHFMLHLEWALLGYWIVGLAGMVMLAALVSGVVMHRKIFREFFTFRPEKSRLRSTLDLHNMTGVISLPFLFVITFSGLLIFARIYFPSVEELMHPMIEAQEKVEEARTGLPAEPAGKPAPLASVDAMMVAAKERWAEKGVAGDVGEVDITHFGDANAYVSIYRDSVDRVATSEALHFSASTGKLIYEDPPASGVEATEGFFEGLHFQWFRHWPLRWLLFTGGLIGCACIATGFLFFVEKRKKKHAEAGVSGARIVDALAVTTITGMLIATCAMMLATKLLPPALQHHETGWLQPVFWLTWLAALAHAAIRSKPVATGHANPAWEEQLWAAALLAVAAVAANWAATGDHLIKTIGEGYWPVAGADLVLLAGAGAAVGVARKLGRRRATPRLRTFDPELVPAE